MNYIDYIVHYIVKLHTKNREECVRGGGGKGREKRERLRKGRALAGNPMKAKESIEGAS